jgi:hypothetical protein
MAYREASGELINNDSWVMGDLWDTRVAQGRGLVTKPRKLASLGVKRLMERAIWAQGLRKKLEPGKKDILIRIITLYESGLKRGVKLQV